MKRISQVFCYYVFTKKKNNHATSSNLHWSYYPHRSRALVSPVRGIFLQATAFSGFSGQFLQPAGETFARPEEQRHTALCVTDGLFMTRIFFLQIVCVSHRQCVSVRDSRCLSKTVFVCQRQAVFVADGICLSQKVFVIHRQSLSVLNSLYLSQMVCVCHKQSAL